MEHDENMKSQETLIQTSIDVANKQLEEAMQRCDSLKVKVLQRYVLMMILYKNLSEEEREDSPITEELSRVSALLRKLAIMENKIERMPVDRAIDEKMMRNKNNSKRKLQSSNPRTKYKRNAEKLSERTKTKADFNIDGEKKSRKMN
ncbi:hypothetical protein ENBRE01_0555 [Enteropsectra breve]|nr:hypothetical protein ENBRE01_0555 [Enteropsectra breve]